MRVLLLLAGLLLCVYSAPLQQHSKLSRAKRAAEQVIFGNHQNNARVKKSGPGVATLLQPLETVKEDEADIDKKALVTSKVTSNEEDQQGQEDLSDDLETDTKSHLEDTAEDELETPPEVATSQEAEEMKDEEVQSQEESQEDATQEESQEDATQEESQEDATQEESQEDATEEENLQQLINENESFPSQSQQSFPMELFDKSNLGSEYMDYPTYDYQDNPYLRRKRSLGQQKKHAVVAEDMMQGGSVMASPGRRSKRDLGQDVRYMWDDVEYPEVERRGYEDPELDEERQELEEMLKEEILKYDPELAEEAAENEVESEDEPYSPEQEAEDLALINYLYQNGYADQDLGPAYEEEEGLEQPWEDMGPARQVSHPPEEASPYFYPYDQYASDENVMSAPYSAVAKRQYLSFVPGMRKRGNDFYPSAYGPDGRWGAMVADDVMEKRAEERMYERLLRLAAALRDRRDELDAERYFADEYPEK